MMDKGKMKTMPSEHVSEMIKKHMSGEKMNAGGQKVDLASIAKKISKKKFGK